MTTGEGGAVLTSNEVMDFLLKDYREFDCRDEYIPRFNFHMTDIQATLGNIQLKRMSWFIARRKFIAEHYQSFFASKGITWQHSSCSIDYNNYRFIINLEAKKKCFLQERLSRANIHTIVPIETKELLHNYLKLSRSDFPVAERISGNTLSLPIYPELSNDELFYILDTLKKIL